MSKYIGTPVVNLSVDTVDVTGDITATDSTPELILLNDTHEDTDGGREGKITFKGEQSGGEVTVLGQIQSSHDGTSDDQKGDLIFKTNDGSDGASPTERMRIDSEGEVGIGRTNPATKLHLQHDTSGEDCVLRIQNAHASSGAEATLNLTASGNNFSIINYPDADTGNANRTTFKSTAGSSFFTFETAASEAMRIDSSGDVGIGTTSPSDSRLYVSDTHTTAVTNASTLIANATLSVNGNSGQGSDVIRMGPICSSGAQFIDASNSSGAAAYRLLINPFSGGTVTIASGVEEAGYGPLQIGSTSTNNVVFQMLSATNGYNTIHMGDTTSGAGRYGGYIQYDHNHDAMNIGTNSVNRIAIASDGQTSVTGAKASYFMWSVTNSQASSGIGTYRSKTNASGDNTSSYHFVGTSSSDRIIIYGNGNIQNTNNSYTALSDSKLKENIVDSGSQWDDIKAIRVRKYSMKEDELDTPNRIGVISQELEEAGMNNLVFESADRDGDGNSLGTTTKAVKYSILYMKAIKALQEAMTRIETLETKVAALEGE